jgi:hypothetical protein
MAVTTAKVLPFAESAWRAIRAYWEAIPDKLKYGCSLGKSQIDFGTIGTVKVLWVKAPLIRAGLDTGNAVSVFVSLGDLEAEVDQMIERAQGVKR